MVDLLSSPDGGLWCSECDENFDEVVEFVDDSGDDSEIVYLCEGCVKAALALFTQSQKGESTR